MQTQILTDPRLEIAESLFEVHSEIRYVLANPLTLLLLSPAQHERLERLLSDIEGIQSALEAIAV